MADGVRFDIAIEANSLGVDSTAEQLNALADRIQFTNKVATTFDRAVAAARARLEEASAAAKLAASSLASAESRYKELESAANKAAKEVEKANAAGKDSTALKASAEAAAAKMREQGAAVDALRVKSDAAAAAQRRMADTLKSLEGQQSAAAVATKAGINKELAGTSDKLKDAGSKAGELKKVEKGASSLGSVTKIAAAAWVAFAAAGIGAVGALGKFAFGIPGNIANMQRLTMAQQRMQLGMQRLFSGLKWDAFTRGLEDVMTLFDQGTSSANGMKKLVETILQPLIDTAAKAAPYVKEMFKGLIYGALQVVIAVLRIRNEIFKAMSPETRAAVKALVDRIFTLENAFKLGAAIAIVLAGVFVALTVALISLAASEFLALLPILLIVAAIALVIAAIIYWDKIVAKVQETLSGWVTAAKDAAKNLITGIVDGIKNGAGAVYDALKNMALGGINAFKNALGIKSPSTVMRLQAKYTADGYVEGIEDNAPRTQSALESMVSPADVGAAAAPGPAKSSVGQSAPAQGARVIQIQQLTIGDSPVAQETFAKFKQSLLEALEGASLEFGGGEAPAT